MAGLCLLAGGCAINEPVFDATGRSQLQFQKDRHECVDIAEAARGAAEAQGERFEGGSAAEELGGMLGGMIASAPRFAGRDYVRCMREKGYREAAPRRGDTI